MADALSASDYYSLLNEQQSSTPELSAEDYARLVSQTSSSTAPTVDDYGRSITQGLTLGLGDEGVALERATARSIMRGNAPWSDPAWSSDYNMELAHERSKQAAFSKENPWTDTALQVVPSMALGLAGAAKSGGTSLARAMLTASGVGGVAGFNTGEGGLSSRLFNAAVTAPIAAGATGVLGSGIHGIRALAKSRLGNALLSRFVDLGDAQAGKIGADITGQTATPIPDAADRIVADRLKYLPPDELANAQIQMATAARENVPLMLPDVAEGTTVGRLVRSLAESPVSRYPIMNAVEERISGTPDRLVSALGAGETPYVAGQKLSTLATEAQRSIERELGAEFSPLYKQAFDANPTISDEAVSNLIPWLDKPTVSGAIRKVQNSTPEYSGLQEDSTKLLHGALSRIKKAVRDYKTPDADRHALGQAADALKDMIPAQIKDIDAQYAQAVTKRNAAHGGVVGELADLDPDKYASAGKRLLNLQPEQTKEFLKLMGEDSKPSVAAAVRGYLQDSFSTGKLSTARELVANRRQQENLKLLLGKDDAETLIRFVNREREMERVGKRVFGGSDTAFKIEEENRGLAEVYRSARKLLTSPFETMLESLDQRMSGLNDPVRESLAQRLSSTGSTLEMLDRIIPMIERNRGIEAVASTAKQSAARGSSRAASTRRKKGK